MPCGNEGAVFFLEYYGTYKHSVFGQSAEFWCLTCLYIVTNH